MSRSMLTWQVLFSDRPAEALQITRRGVSIRCVGGAVLKSVVTDVINRSHLLSMVR